MLSSSLLTRSAALFFASALSISTGSAQSYHLTDLGVISGQQFSIAGKINQQGQVAGSSEFYASRYNNGVQENLGTLTGGTVSSGFGINNLGAVVGESQFTDGGSIRHATLFQDGARTDLGFLPNAGNYSSARAINDSGQVVGYGGPKRDTTSTHAFIWDAANGMREIAGPGGGWAKAFSINNAGQVSGTTSSLTATNSSIAFIWDATNGVREIGTIGGIFSYGNAINANGHIAGTSTINNFDNRQHAFLYDGSTMRDLGSLGDEDFYSDRSSGSGINIHDHVVGSTYRQYTGGGLYGIPFIYRDGTMQDLSLMVDSSGEDYVVGGPSGINDAGQITATATKRSTNESRAVVLTPTPKIDLLSRLGNGQLRLQARGEANKTYRVLTYSNAIAGSFTNVGSVTAGANGAIQFDHTPPIGTAQYFYRLSP